MSRRIDYQPGQGPMRGVVFGIALAAACWAFIGLAVVVVRWLA